MERIQTEEWEQELFDNLEHMPATGLRESRGDDAVAAQGAPRASEEDVRTAFAGMTHPLDDEEEDHCPRLA